MEKCKKNASMTRAIIWIEMNMIELDRILWNVRSILKCRNENVHNVNRLSV